MKGSKERDSPKRFIPAIPDGFCPVCDVARIYEINERVTAFDDRDHETLRGFRGHFVSGNLEGQVSLFE